ncbi:MAG: hypothetical protein AAGB22_02940, partial [Bacteroidota bacterium]
MKRRTIRLIIMLSTALLIGLMITQIFWVNKAYRVTEVQLDHDITTVLVDVARQILEHRNDSSQLVDPVREPSPFFYVVSINDTLHPDYLEALLTNELAARELDIDFEYSIYDCFNDSVVFTEVV